MSYKLRFYIDPPFLAYPQNLNTLLILKVFLKTRHCKKAISFLINQWRREASRLYPSLIAFFKFYINQINNKAN